MIVPGGCRGDDCADSANIDVVFIYLYADVKEQKPGDYPLGG